MSEELMPELLMAVEQQLESPATRYVRTTYDRLTRQGIEADEAKQQIALCLGEEMDRVQRSKRAFDEKAYRASLDELPLEEEHDAEELSDS